MMALPQKLLDKLACPKCHGSLEYRPEKDQLICPNCRLVFRVADDIPVLEIETAEKLK
ncbi:MAG: Trm112 family protein [Candidatus Zixiibacteriota bacterium]